MIILVGSMGNRHVPVIIMVEITGTGVAKKNCVIVWFYEPSGTASRMMRVNGNMKCLFVVMCVVNVASF